MPYGDPAPSDPNVLVGVGLWCDIDAVREMVCAFVEEFAAIGYDEESVLMMFQTPLYAGPYAACQTLGEEAVRRIARDHFRLRDEVRSGLRHPPRPDSDATRPDEGGGRSDE